MTDNISLIDFDILPWLSFDLDFKHTFTTIVAKGYCN